MTGGSRRGRTGYACESVQERQRNRFFAADPAQLSEARRYLERALQGVATLANLQRHDSQVACGTTTRRLSLDLLAHLTAAVENEVTAALEAQLDAAVGPGSSDIPLRSEHR